MMMDGSAPPTAPTTATTTTATAFTGPDVLIAHGNHNDRLSDGAHQGPRNQLPASLSCATSANDCSVHQHATLLTVGEGCLHLVCEFLRQDLYTKRRQHLSRLGRTCRRLYIAVRNLPSILEQADPELMIQPLPAQAHLEDIAHWCDILGVVWDLISQEQVKSICVEEEHTEREKEASTEIVGHIANRETVEPSAKLSVVTAQALQKAFFRIHARLMWQILSDDAALQHLEAIASHCGGLDFAVSSGKPGLSFDLLKCTHLRYLHVSLLANTVPPALRAMLQQRHAPLDCFHLAIAPLQHSAFTDNDVLTLATSLSLSLTSWLTDTAPLTTYGKLELCLCNALPSITGLKHIGTLLLDRCKELATVHGLSNVQTISVIDCDKLVSVSNLTSVHSLTVFRCGALERINNITGASSVALRACPNLVSVSALRSVHTVSFNYCKGLTQLSKLSNIHYVNANDTRKLSELSQFHDVHRVFIHQAFALQDVTALGDVHTLYLSVCSGVHDVSPLVGVKKLTLNHCTAIRRGLQATKEKVPDFTFIK